MPYIHLDLDLAKDPRILAHAQGVRAEIGIVDQLTRIPLSKVDHSALICNALLGALVTLWAYADQYIEPCNIITSDAETLGAVLNIPSVLLRNLPPEFFVEHPNGTIELPGYYQRNNLKMRDIRRTQTKERVRRMRERRAASRITADDKVSLGNAVGNAVGNADVTQAVTHECNARNATQDQDQDQVKEKQREDAASGSLPQCGENATQGKRDKRQGGVDRGTALPADWRLPDDWRAWTREQKPAWTDADIEAVAEQFRDYWVANRNQRHAKKADWLATWRNWVRRERDTRRPGAPMQPAGSGENKPLAPVFRADADE